MAKQRKTFFTVTAAHEFRDSMKKTYPESHPVIKNDQVSGNPYVEWVV